MEPSEKGVTPAKAGIQVKANELILLAPNFRRNDG
jgi:hypothetical protein